jgi:hypothetical protein
MKPTLKDAKRLAKKLHTTVSPKRLLVGMRVEMEHDSPDSRLNVTHGNLETIAKIALAHFEENPGAQDFGDYYEQLKTIESQSDKYWKTHFKPMIFDDLTAYDIAFMN